LPRQGVTLGVTAAFTSSLATVIGPRDFTPQAVAANPAATVIATYRGRIPELMAEQGIPGLPVAVVDADRTLWVEGFGHIDAGGSAPVTADTIFSAESMSKLFTATAVMQAVAAGRLDLDAPITTYLPEFTVHSAYEKHPERKITLRMLLSHTTGFTHEAPVGNNNELDPGTFDAHVRSISDTWLRFPVGTGYAYSNLGIDLAGYILERVEGKPFVELMRDSLLEPLGMNHSSFDRSVIRATAGRAVGHVHPYPKPPLDVPMTAAGGLYTSAADLARFLRFELNNGSIDDRVVLDSKRLHEMETVSPPHVGAPAGYALWRRPTPLEPLGRTTRPLRARRGGFGFLSDLWWLPQLGIGVAVLTNSQDHQLQNALSLSILTDLVSGRVCIRIGCLRCPGGRRRPTRIPFSIRRPGWPPSSLTTHGRDARSGHALGRLCRPLPNALVGLPRAARAAGPVRRRRRRPVLRDRRQRGRAHSSPPRRNQARPVPRRQRGDARPAGTGRHLAEPSPRSRLGRPLPMAVGAPRGSRARRRRVDGRPRRWWRVRPHCLSSETSPCSRGFPGSSTPGSRARSTCRRLSNWPCTCRWP
jgi:CubicO group peptidase (beta-lactamase class C family)